MVKHHLLALLLNSMEGVGRASAHRILARFESLESLQQFPREQVLTRLKGIPGGNDIVKRLFDPSLSAEMASRAQAELANLDQYRVTLLTPRDKAWPAPFEQIPEKDRPFILYLHGNAAPLTKKRLAIHGVSPLSTAGFERAQSISEGIQNEGVIPVLGASDGFDIALHKKALGGNPPGTPIAIVHGGLSTIVPQFRPTATAVSRGGGLLLSAFPMTHQAYPHDERFSIYCMGLLCHATLFVEPVPESSSWSAMTRLMKHQIPLFGIPHPEHPLPEAVHGISSMEEIEWIQSAIAISPL